MSKVAIVAISDAKGNEPLRRVVSHLTAPKSLEQEDGAVARACLRIQSGWDQRTRRARANAGLRRRLCLLACVEHKLRACG